MHNSTLVTNTELSLQAMLPKACTHPRLMPPHEKSWVVPPVGAPPSCAEVQRQWDMTWRHMESLESWELTHCFSYWDAWLKGYIYLKKKIKSKHFTEIQDCLSLKNSFKENFCFSLIKTDCNDCSYLNWTVLEGLALIYKNLRLFRHWKSFVYHKEPFCSWFILLIT